MWGAHPHPASRIASSIDRDKHSATEKREREGANAKETESERKKDAPQDARRKRRRWTRQPQRRKDAKGVNHDAITHQASDAATADRIHREGRWPRCPAQDPTPVAAPNGTRAHTHTCTFLRARARTRPRRALSVHTMATMRRCASVVALVAVLAATAAAARNVTCPTNPLGPGLHTFTLDYDGLER